MKKLIYLSVFITSVSYALVYYANSTFLGKFIPSGLLGFIYGASSLIALFFLAKTSGILRKWGQFKFMQAVLATETGSLFLLSASALLQNHLPNFILSILVVLSFFILYVSVVLSWLSYDIYLEKYSDDAGTGLTRGTFFTVINLAIAIAPFLTGKILAGENFWRLYFASAILMFPALMIINRRFKGVPDVPYHNPPFWDTLAKVWKNKDIYSIFASSFLLQFFYSWMVIYTPIYLNQVMKFSWDTIGIIFTIMLLPFIFIQLPLGKIADKYLGEKEILTVGFFVMGISTIALSFIESPNPIIWAAILFVTRIGAAAVEIMNDTYFFKKVSPCDSNFIGFFRNASPFAFLVGPIAASIAIYLFGFQSIFLILGVLMLLGMRYGLAITDTL